MNLDDPMAHRDPPEHALPFLARWPLLSGMVAGLLLRLVYSGGPGGAFQAMMASFIFLGPILVGAVTVYVAERQKRRSWSYYFWAAASANALVVVGTVLIMVEGLICAILFVPLCGLVGGFGGLAMGAICRLSRWPRHAVYGFAVLPLLLGGFEQTLTLPDQFGELHSMRLVAASPEQVWAQLHATSDITPAEVGDAWMYRIGVPLPVSGLTVDEDGRHVRHVVMGKNIHFDQVAVEWEAPRRVRWAYRFTEDSFPAGALDDHVRIGGHYFDILDTEYVLTPKDGVTELSMTMRYRVSTHFNWYTAPIADFLIGNFEQVILRLYAQRAEAAARANRSAPSASATSIPSTPALMMPPA